MHQCVDTAAPSSDISRLVADRMVIVERANDFHAVHDCVFSIAVIPSQVLENQTRFFQLVRYVGRDNQARFAPICE